MNDSQSATVAADRSRSRLGKKRHVLLQLALLVAVTSAVAVTGMSLNGYLQDLFPEDKPLASIFNRKPSGVSGLMEINSRLGLNCRAWVLPYRKLSTIKGVLVIIAPSDSLEEFEAEQILNWVAEGNKLVYLDHFAYKMTRRLLQKLNIDVRDGRSLVDTHIAAAGAQMCFAHVKELVITADTRLSLVPALVSDSSGTLIAAVQHGKGEVLLATAPSLVSNWRLTSTDGWANFQFLSNWINQGHAEIWFDERCHGFSQNGNVFIVLARGTTGIVFLQLLLILAVAVASASQRFGSIKTVEVKRSISNLEFITGLANAYQRARANAATLEILGQSCKNKLCKLLAISPHEATTLSILETWQSSRFASSALGSPVAKFLTDYDAALQRKSVTDAELKSLVITCDKITEQLKEIPSDQLSLAARGT